MKDNLIEKRIKKGVSIKEITHKTGLNREDIYKIERGLCICNEMVSEYKRAVNELAAS